MADGTLVIVSPKRQLEYGQTCRDAVLRPAELSQHCLFLFQVFSSYSLFGLVDYRDTMDVPNGISTGAVMRGLAWSNIAVIFSNS